MKKRADSRKPEREFSLAVASHFLRGRWWIPDGHQPPVGHVVPDAFAGVGVAASADPQVDDWMIARLEAAGLYYVRLDFTYGDSEESAGRLLEALLSRSFKVMLHLLQPFAVARIMQPGATGADVAQEEWRHFVAASLDRFGDRVELVEVCSTVNRRRWAGYTLAGFLAMWTIAHEEVRARGLTLAGPSVTDFEPPWNVGLLAILRDRGLLPDFHSDNLFAERSTEPERFDHKILGRRLAGWHKFNLIKKARLVARIGEDNGVPRLMSPAAFWTLPRIERQLVDSEQKQADYLARYMVLCAASGALERAWWGALICHREGLVDNGKRPYPVLERITHYASVEGTIADLRVRPAFDALQTFAALVPGSRYEGRLNDSDGLEVHAFRCDECLLHVVWTINGKAAALDELYTQEHLAAAKFLDRNGNIEDADAAPHILICESPRYLCWPSTHAVVINRSVGLIPGCALSVHDRPEFRPYLFRDGDWRGIVFARTFAEYQRLHQALHPATLRVPAKRDNLRYARNAIWKVVDPRSEGEWLVVKKPVRMPAYRRFFDRNRPVKGLRSWSGTCELLRVGVDAAVPVAYFELCSDSSRIENFYICEYVPAEASVREMVSALNGGKGGFAGVPAAALYRVLAAYVVRMHNGGIFFRDMSGGNILVRHGANKSGPGDGLSDPQFSLIDTGRIRMYPQGVPMRQRLADLARVCNKMNATVRYDFLSAYLATINRKIEWHTHIPFLLYDLKIWLKRKIGRKAIQRALRSVNKKGD